VPCRHCLKSACPQGHHDCLMKVQSDDVVHAAMALMRTTQHDAPAIRASAKQPQLQAQGTA
jgi:hypothetical protein